MQREQITLMAAAAALYTRNGCNSRHELFASNSIPLPPVSLMLTPVYLHFRILGLFAFEFVPKINMCSHASVGSRSLRHRHAYICMFSAWAKALLD